MEMMDPPPSKSPRTFAHGGASGGDGGSVKSKISGGGAGGDDSSSAPQSTPGSPSFSRSRLGKVSKLISRSDANLENVRVKRLRNYSGDQSEELVAFHGEVTGSGEDGSGSSTGSPSKGFLSKATGYMNHLKSRLAKHRDKSKERESSRTTSPAHHHFPQPHSTTTVQGSFSSCCGHARGVDSSDTLATFGGHPGSGRHHQNGNSGAATTSSPSGNISGSISVNVSSRIGEGESLDFDLVGSGGGGSGSQGETRSKVEPEMASSVPMSSNNPNAFYTLNVYLLRGKNLVARDACGSSDPYVKVKVGDKLYYKTKTIYRDLNPFWDESFVLPVNDITQPVVFRVFDYDWGFQDDFMGMTSIDLTYLPLHKSQEMSLTLTENNLPSETPMGEIVLTVTLVPRTSEEKDVLNYCIPPLPKSLRSAIHTKIDHSIKWLDTQSSGRLVDSQRRLKSQIWSSVLTVLLLEATNLSPSGDDKLLMDAFVKFRLGSQKYKSRTVSRSATPKWLEQFDLYLYEGQPQVLEVQLFDEAFSRDYIGRCSIDIGLLEKETTHNVTIPLQEGPGQISFLLTISGTSGTETISDLANYNPSTEEVDIIKSRYELGRSFHNLKDVGHLTVKVYEAQGLAAADLGGKSDPFVVLELVNARLQTQTEYRTLTPCWNKIFTFAVKDITSILEVTVYDEDTNHKTEFLGKLLIPLWKITNGEKKWYVLKDRKLLRQAKGNSPQILLEMDLIWNPVRAGLRVMDPPEPKFLLPDQRLNREIFLLNIDRLRTICVGIYDVMQYVQSCMEWESPVRSIIALLLYQIICYTFQPYFIPLILMLLILRTWFICTITGTPLPEEYPEDGEPLVLDEEDGDSQADGEEKKMSLRQKLQAVQDATQTLQNALGSIASICESTRNTFRMVVPFISWLAVLGLFVATVVLFLIPVRYLAMAWGLHRSLRPILRPNVKPTDEVYNLLLRVPDNQQLITQKPLRITQIPDTAQRSNRSPPNKPPHQKKKHKFW